VATNVEGDDPAAEGAHGPDDRRHLVDRVGNHVASGAEPAADEWVAFAEKPLGLADGARGADEEIFDHEVEEASLAPEMVEGVSEDQLHTEVVEVEVAARDPDDLGVELDAHDLGRGVQDANRTGHAAGGQPQNQDAPGTPAGDQQNRRGERPPHHSGETVAGAVNRRLSAVDPHLDPAADTANLDLLAPSGRPRIER
jgi:hypothetical protein